MPTPNEVAADIDEIVRGCHADPFRILGPHPDGDGWIVRTFQPFASGVDVILDGVATPMKRIREEGFFAARLDGQARRYLLGLTRFDGVQDVVEDPYRFWAALEDRGLHRFGSGINTRSHEMLGAHLIEEDGVHGVRFAVWAPNALSVCLAGDFNSWDTRRHPLRLRDSGVWEIFIPGIGAGEKYKYMVRSRVQVSERLKTDPFGFAFEEPPRSASMVVDLARYQWTDKEWMTRRGQRNWLQEPVSIYEVHLESWLRGPQGEPLTYREMASALVDYATRLGYTHIELLPILEHPFGGSWGYQVTGYFAPTARFGPPEDFMYLVDCCHQANIGVILDWVPAHFPKDEHALARFDGTALYEHEDPRQGEHRDWGTLVFNFGRNEVRSFLLSSAIFWLEKYHLDGLRVDAVASMLYLDYSREPGQWLPNRHGGRENLDAIEFLQRFNEEVHKIPGAITLAEESTSFAGVSRPVYVGGLGFTMKWNMGWMHDMLEYFSLDPIFRRFHQQNITFSMLYAFTENFVLPVSHDEVVHLKKSLIGKMPGDEWRRFANVRAFLAYMYTHPGKKLLFMGSEIGQYEEWSHEGQVRWELLEFDYHRKLQHFVGELNRIYRAEPSLHEVDFDWRGFEWVDLRDSDSSTISFLRRASDPSDFVLVCCNFTPIPRPGYRLGVPLPGFYREILNSDSIAFGGSNMGNMGGIVAHATPSHGRPCSVILTLPPLAVVVLRGPHGGSIAAA